MCGRFSFAAKARIIEERFDVKVDDGLYRPRYNCAPTQNLAVISNTRPGELVFFRWGLIPFWAKDISIGSKMINAKAETLGEKPSFRQAFKQRRCLVISDGFYEWKKDGAKQPFSFLMKGETLFAMAGLWDRWRNEQGEDIFSFTIITTIANDTVAPVHHRMPVILPRKAERLWLADLPEDQLKNLLVPFPSEEMQCYPIGKMINSPTNDQAGVWEALK